MTTEGLPRLSGGASAVKAPVPSISRPVDPVRTPPIKFTAFGGLLVALLMAYVWGKWITGPNFTPVPPGPTRAPDWMILALRAFEIGGLVLAAFVIWRFVVRPWRRSGQPTTDGLLIIGFATVWFQDPFSTYYVNWFTYNTNLINFGSWVQDVPGWVSYGGPGHTIAEPIVFIGASYVYFLFISVVFGTWVMRTVKQRRPNIQAWQQIVICFVAMCLVDLVAEGLIWMPMGFWSYPGGHGVLFSNTYHKFAVEEMVPIGLMFTGLSALRYFRDDRGYTLAERGVDQLKGSPRRIAVVRVLAVLFAVHAITFLLYTVPAAWWVTHPVAWPQDTMNRSYFTSGLCADGTDRACSGPGVPFATNKSTYMTRDGKLGFPPGHQP